MISVLIPTLNEEENISFALESAVKVSDDIVVLDSGSSDKTEEIVKSFANANQTCCIRFLFHHFEGYGRQWNWAIDNIEFKYLWFFLLAADERISLELAENIKKCFSKKVPESISAFYMKRKFIWMNKWIKHGGVYPFLDARLFKRGKAYYDDRGVNEHLIVTGETGILEGDIIHHDMKEKLEHWINKHVKYAELEAKALFKYKMNERNILKPKLFGNQVQRKRWIREYIWNPLMPPLVRPFVYFFYRYFFRLGFLDGKEGLIYHFLQGLWYIFLIDVQYLEMKCKKGEEKGRKT